MTRRLLPALAVLGLLAVAVAALWARSDDRSPSLASPQVASPEAAPAGPARIEASPQPAGASLCGVVVEERGERPVADAEVALAGPERVVTLVAGPAGQWCFRELAAGDYTLLARSGRHRSEPIVELPLGPGEELRELVLVIRSGVAVLGRVRDGATGEAIAGARISAHVGALAVTQAHSDRSGDFRLEGLLGGGYRLEVRATGYGSRDVALEVPPERPVRGVEINLDRTARLAGRVVGQDDQGLGGARVRASAYRLGASAAAVGEVVADPEGAFSIETAPGLVTLTATSPGHAPAILDGLEVAPGAELQGLILRAGAPAGLLVEVLAPGGEPAAGARVEVTCGRAQTCGSASTDGEGRAAFSELAPGDARVRAMHPVGGEATASVELAAGLERRLTLALAGTRPVTGRVEDAQGRPQEGAEVRLTAETGGPARVTRTGPDGRFSIDAPVGVPHTAEATGPDGRAKAQQRGVLAGDTLRLVVSRPGSIVGQVIDDAGRPVTDFTLTFVPVGASRSGYRREHVLTETGDFAIHDLPGGGYALRASSPGHAPSEPLAVTVDPGREAGPVRLQLGAGGRVFGRILGPDGEPAGGVRVGLGRDAVFGLGRWSGGAGPTTESAPDGSFQLAGVPPGVVQLLAWHATRFMGGGSRVRVEGGGETGPVLLRLRRSPHAREPDEPFGGVGMTLAGDPEGRVLVMQVFEGGPAFLAGLRRGDRLLAVDGAPTGTLGLRGTLEAIRGPVGTLVVLSLEHPDTGERFEARLLRVLLRL